jgi:putative lipoprotein (rSAM/lipoprotein system)
MTLKTLLLYSKLLSFLLVLLGLTACDSDGGSSGNATEYNTPSAKFVVKGTLVDKIANPAGISGMKVAIGHPYEDEAGGKMIFYVDSVVTNRTGAFIVNFRDFPASQTFVVKYEDTSMSQEGNYGLTVDTIRFEKPSFTGGNGRWYRGETTKNLGKVDLSPAADRE